MLDFESAIWRAIAVTFPGVLCRGCIFHWKQAVWRKVQEVGLQRAYTKKNEFYVVLNKLMSLPYLPKEVIPDQFHLLRVHGEQSEMLQEVKINIVTHMGGFN